MPDTQTAQPGTAPQAPGFDVDGARKAGYSDDEILDHLAKSKNFDADAALKQKFSKQDLIQFLSGSSGTNPSVPNPSSPMVIAPGQKMPDKPNADLSPEVGRQLVNGALTALPYVGGTVGGLLTGGAGLVPAMAAAAGGQGLGSLTEQIGRAITGIDPPKSVGDAAKTVAGDVAGGAASELGGRLPGMILGKVLGNHLAPESIYRRALRPAGAGMNDVEAQKAVRAGLENEIPLSADALPRVERMRKAIASDIDNLISSQPADIPPADYMRNLQGKLDDLRSTWGKVAGSNNRNIAQIDNFERQFLLESGNPRPIVTRKMVPDPSGLVDASGNPLMVSKRVVIDPEDMDLATLRTRVQPIQSQDAQAIKEGTHKSIRSKNASAYAPEVHPGLQLELEQNTSRAMKQELENIYPDLKSMNEDEGSMIALRKAIRGFAQREGNKQVSPYLISGAMGALGGAFFGGPEGAGAGAATGVLGMHLTHQMLHDPVIMSKLAIALKRAGSSSGPALASKVFSGPNVLRAAEFTGDQANERRADATQQADKAAGTVKLSAPDGSVRDVAQSDVDHYLSLGAKRVQ